MVICDMASEAYDLVITNGVVVTADEIRKVDIAINGETITAIEERGAFSNAKVARVIDARGGWVMPGGIVSSSYSGPNTITADGLHLGCSCTQATSNIGSTTALELI